MVTLCEGTPESTGLHGGRGPRLWGFGYTTLSKLLGMSEGAVRQAVYDGRLDPSDLEMVCESWMHFHPGKARSFVADLDWRERENRTAKTPEEQQVLEALRQAREARLAPPKPVTLEEIKRLAGVLGGGAGGWPGPTPGDMLRQSEAPPLDLKDPEVGGTINARCAEANHPRVIKCKACGLDLELHTTDDLAECMEKLCPAPF